MVSDQSYFNQLSGTSEEFILPYIESFSKFSEVSDILEIGCGQGGLLHPFALRGHRICGIDINLRKIQFAKEYFQDFSSAEFICDDILTTGALDGRKFDLIIIHDVIEHINKKDKYEFFDRAVNLLKKDGLIFWGFPAWRMPFGGHQQICSSIIRRIPYIHLLPLKSYRTILSFFNEDKQIVEELISIKNSRVSIKCFEEACSRHHLVIRNRTLWLINPHYKAKFNLRPLKLGPVIRHVPYLRDFFSTSCFYITTE